MPTLAVAGPQAFPWDDFIQKQLPFCKIVGGVPTPSMGPLLGLDCDAAGTRFVCAVIHLPCIPLKNSLGDHHSLKATATGGFLVLVLAGGQQPPSIRVGREDRTPDAVCVRDALGKPERETNPSFGRRAELLPGVGPVISPVPFTARW